MFPVSRISHEKLESLINERADRILASGNLSEMSAGGSLNQQRVCLSEGVFYVIRVRVCGCLKKGALSVPYPVKLFSLPRRILQMKGEAAKSTAKKKDKKKPKGGSCVFQK